MKPAVIGVIVMQRLAKNELMLINVPAKFGARSIKFIY